MYWRWSNTTLLARFFSRQLTNNAFKIWKLEGPLRSGSSYKKRIKNIVSVACFLIYNVRLTILDADGVCPRRAASPPPHTFASVATARPFSGDNIAPRPGAHLGRVFSEHGVHGRRDPPCLLRLIGRRGTHALRVHPEATVPSCVAAPSTAMSSPCTATRRCPWATGPSCSSSPAARAFRNSSAAHDLSKDRFSFMLLAQNWWWFTFFSSIHMMQFLYDSFSQSFMDCRNFFTFMWC